MFGPYHCSFPLLKGKNSAESHQRFSQGTTRPLWPCPAFPGSLPTPVHGPWGDIQAQAWPPKPGLSYSVGLQPWLWHQLLLLLTESHGCTLDLVHHLPYWGLPVGPVISPRLCPSCSDPTGQILRISESLPLSCNPTSAAPCQIHRDKGRVSDPVMSFSNSLDSAIVFTFFSNVPWKCKSFWSN